MTRLLLSKLLPTYLGACPFAALFILMPVTGKQMHAEKGESIIPDQTETRHHTKKSIQSFQGMQEQMLTLLTIGICEFKSSPLA